MGKKPIGGNILKVIKYWKDIFETDEIADDGSQFDTLWADEEVFTIGDIKAKVIYTSGHMPACGSYLIEDYLFSVDTLFSPLVGTARTDFPGGSSEELFNSVQKISQLPDEIKICVGHEYPQPNAEPVIITKIGEETANNVSINSTTKKSDYLAKIFIKQINKPVPQLMLPSLYINLLGGRLPRFIKIPINKIYNK